MILHSYAFAADKYQYLLSQPPKANHLVFVKSLSTLFAEIPCKFSTLIYLGEAQLGIGIPHFHHTGGCDTSTGIFKDSLPEADILIQVTWSN